MFLRGGWKVQGLQVASLVSNSAVWDENFVNKEKVIMYWWGF